MFMLIAEHRSFSEAARSAGISQPALSRTVRVLEEQLSIRLFDRDSRNVSLTPAGEKLLPVVARLTADFDGAFSELAGNLEVGPDRVVIGALPAMAAGPLPAAIARFTTERPQADVTIRDLPSDELRRQILERQIDFAVTTRPHGSDLDFEPLIDDPMMLVAAKGAKADKAGDASWAEFGQYPLAAMTANSEIRALSDAGLIGANVAATPSFECAHVATLGAIVEADLGIAAMPRSTFVTLRSGSMVARPLRNPVITRSIGIARLGGRTLSAGASALIKVVEETLAGGATSERTA